jgi:uncharacterized protein
MDTPMCTRAVPAFKQMLEALKTMLAMTDVHVASKGMEPHALPQARLFPDLFPFNKQVQIAADCSRDMAARPAGVGVPASESTKGNEIVLRPGTPKEKKLSGQDRLADCGLPGRFCHVTTAHAIQRRDAMAIGKREYMGAH